MPSTIDHTALSTMEVDFPDEPLTEAARAYFVLVAGEENLPARDAAAPMALVATGDSERGIASGFVLHAAYPNPFNPQAQIRYQLAERAHVRIAVFDALGRQLTLVVDGIVEPGLHSEIFDGTGLASGLYLLQATIDVQSTGKRHAFTQRLTLLK